jgi:class 3 adenylate cyclase
VPTACRTIGEEGRLEYAVIGDPVNRAAKIQNHTKVEGVRALTSVFARQAHRPGLCPETGEAHSAGPRGRGRRRADRPRGHRIADYALIRS